MWEHWVWKDKPFNQSMAWIDMLMLANHKDAKVPYKGNITIVKRGEFIRSERDLAKRWGWSRGRVRCFIVLLKQDGMIVRKTAQVAGHITILNYNKYQEPWKLKSPVKAQPKPSQSPAKALNNNVNNENNVNNKHNGQAGEVLLYLNQKIGKNFKKTDEIQARLREGGTVNQCKQIIDTKLKDPHFQENPKFYNPVTLFRKSHWDNYLNENPDDYEGHDDDWKRRFLRSDK
ncbi:MAG TPA: hypothetical protein DCL81_08565 [Algoriphagus sp.]|jgi:uncharacterized phage protein (TIGR02220 family)|nr:hypothetical protein [Algoriphagus sp.]